MRLKAGTWLDLDKNRMTDALSNRAMTQWLSPLAVADSPAPASEARFTFKSVEATSGFEPLNRGFAAINNGLFDHAEPRPATFSRVLPGFRRGCRGLGEE